METGEEKLGEKEKCGEAGGENSLIIKTVLRKKKRVGCPPPSQRSAGFLGRSVSLHPQEG